LRNSPIYIIVGIQVFSTSPEVAKSTCWIVLAVRRMNFSNRGVSWSISETKYLSIIANVDFDVMEASLEQNCVSGVTELCSEIFSAHFSVDLINKNLTS